MGRRRGPAARTLRPAGLRGRPPHHPPRHLRRDPGACPGRGEPPAARHLPGGYPRPPGHRPSAPLPDPVRRGEGRRRPRRCGACASPGSRPAPPPTVAFEHDGQAREATAPLLVGADGRASMVREAAGIPLHQDAPHHWFAGLLVEDAHDWDPQLQAIGTEDDFGFLAFPQGDGKVRVYGGYPLDQARRFKGSDGPRRFLDAFALACSPKNAALVSGKPAGPLFAYVNADSWTDEPCAPGVVLIGDAAGWNDPIIGLGLSITYRDVRLVSDILKATDDWARVDFGAYAEERAERMRRLRFVGQITAAIDMEFGEAARARRRSLFERSAADPGLKAHAFAVMAGPESLPSELFTDAHRARVLEG
ncbi:FAD-dependent monooxygenase [Phenylobacterium sp. J367]|nr:FAD-dependent monooxygenase [Phenylobacterium sp. J367]